MPRPPATTVSLSLSAPLWQLHALPAALGIVALATAVLGVGLLILHARLAEVEHLLAPSGIALVACGLLQCRTAWRVWNHRVGAPAVRLQGWAFFRRLFVGLFLAYVAAAMIGPARYIEFAFLAVVAAWYTLLLLPLGSSTQVLAQWRKWTQERAARRMNALIVAAILLAIVAEGGLWTHKFARQHGWLGRGRSTLAARIELGGTASFGGNLGSGSYSAGTLRVAVLTDEADVHSGRSNGYLVRIEQLLADVEILPIRIAGPWSSQTAGDLAARLSAARADLVLAVLPVCEDLTRDVPQASWFDWRQFELARFVVNPAAEKPAAAPAPMDDFEAFCRALAPQLAACRIPLDDAMLARWQQRFQSLDDLVAECRAAEVNLALVLVPGEFQVNRALCDTLARRAGCHSEQIDVELPQRKLAAFAERQGLALVDLLPSLRLCRESPYLRNSGTWSEVGHEAAAAAIGGWLESRYSRQRAVAAQLTVAP